MDSAKSDPSRCDGLASELLNETNPVEKWLDSADYSNTVISLALTPVLCPQGVCRRSSATC